MSPKYDTTEFVDTDFQAASQTVYPAAYAASGQNAPTREEVDRKVAEAQQKLAELKRVQEELERERAALEETRRRQMELHTGRQEMIQHLTRGLGLLEEAEFAARRDAEQMAKTVADMKDALSKLQAISEENWSREDFATELTRSLTVIENARMEWNSARLKFPVLSAEPSEADASSTAGGNPASVFGARSFPELCKLGLALTWPLAAVALLALIALLVFLSRH